MFISRQGPSCSVLPTEVMPPSRQTGVRTLLLQRGVVRLSPGRLLRPRRPEWWETLGQIPEDRFLPEDVRWCAGQEPLLLLADLAGFGEERPTPRWPNCTS